jgi:hypothetical protein
LTIIANFIQFAATPEAPELVSEEDYGAFLQFLGETPKELLSASLPHVPDMAKVILLQALENLQK